MRRVVNMKREKSGRGWGQTIRREREKRKVKSKVIRGARKRSVGIDAIF